MDSPVPHQIRPLKRAECDKLIELGAFQDERIELLEGAMVAMPPIGAPHSSAVQELNRILLPALLGRATVRIQNPFAAICRSRRAGRGGAHVAMTAPLTTGSRDPVSPAQEFEQLRVVRGHGSEIGAHQLALPPGAARAAMGREAVLVEQRADVARRAIRKRVVGE